MIVTIMVRAMMVSMIMTTTIAATALPTASSGSTDVSQSSDGGAERRRRPYCWPPCWRAVLAAALIVPLPLRLPPSVVTGCVEMAVVVADCDAILSCSECRRCRHRLLLLLFAVASSAAPGSGRRGPANVGIAVRRPAASIAAPCAVPVTRQRFRIALRSVGTGGRGHQDRVAGRRRRNAAVGATVYRERPRKRLLFVHQPQQEVPCDRPAIAGRPRDRRRPGAAQRRAC